MDGARHSRISVVILTHNRAPEVLNTIRHMSALPERPRLVVVDNASSDGTAEQIGAQFPSVAVIRLAKNIGAAARNAGVHSVETPYVAFCDDDTMWAPGSLAKACRLLDEWPGIAALTAHVLVGPEQRDDSACAMMDASPLPSTGLPGKAVLGFLAGACVFRRRTFLAMGGYEPRFLIGGEEALLAIDLVARGHVVVYTKELRVHHYPSARRNMTQRQRHSVRNALWVAWLRRPFLSAVGCTLDILARADGPRSALAGLLDAGRELCWVLRKRQVIPPRVEALCALLENHRRERLPLRYS
jgi:GT2 family glycosyltransferase